MLNYIWPLALVVASNVLYQICAKAVKPEINPLASVTVTYLVGALVSGLLYYLLNKDANLLREYSHLNWAPFMLGFAIVGLEAGFIYAYKAGWQVSTASLVQGTILAIILIFLGVALYRESFTRDKLIGVIFCLIGLFFINRN